MADPTPVTAADLKALKGELETAHKAEIDQLKADVKAKLKAQDEAMEATLKDFGKRLAKVEGKPAKAVHYPFKHTETGVLARIIEQGNDTIFETEDGERARVDTPTFTRQFHEADPPAQVEAI